MSATPAKFSFDSGGDFIRETRREVELYLARRRTRVRGRIQLYAKTAVAFGLFAVSWTSLIIIQPGLVLGLVSLAGLSLGSIMIGFCVQHDANHGAYFRTRRANHLLGWSADALLGISSYFWRIKHNVAHHTYTNVDGYDDDIDQTPFARMMPSQESKPWYRLQHLYIWPLYSFMVIRLQAGADLGALLRGRIGQTKVRAPKGWDLAGLIAGKLIFVSLVFVAPLLVYPWWVVLLGYVGFTMITSLVTATTFQLAHCVEEAQFVSPEELAATPRPWADHELETTVDFCPGNPVLTWLLGGLNFQIEHHLFPRVAHTHYPRIAAIVKRNAERNGLRYSVQPSLRGAIASHHRHLRELGRLGVPVEIEMG